MDRTRELAASRGIRLSWIADQVGMGGRRRSHFYKIVEGERKPPAGLPESVARVLGVNADELRPSEETGKAA